MKNRTKVMGECYQIAGHRLLMEDQLTEGQRERLTELLMDMLEDPNRYKVKVWRRLAKLAVMP